MAERAAVDAPAKINLFLRVLERRLDGYHGIETMYQSIDLADEVVVERTGAGTTLAVSGADLGPPEENLAYRAAEAYRRVAGLGGGVRIGLTKRIPAGAGLGGGSSDAAAVLRCLDALLGAVTAERLVEVAARLGSDVPFFLGPAARALGTGRGEMLGPREALPVGHLVLTLPPVHVSTARAYAALAEARAGRSAPAARPEPPLHSWDDVCAAAENDFERVVPGIFPEVALSLAALREGGARLALLSGSGGAAFGLFGSAERAGEAATALSTRLGWPCVVARTLRAPPPVVLADDP